MLGMTGTQVEIVGLGPATHKQPGNGVVGPDHEDKSQARSGLLAQHLQRVHLQTKQHLKHRCPLCSYHEVRDSNMQPEAPPTHNPFSCFRFCVCVLVVMARIVVPVLRSGEGCFFWGGGGRVGVLVLMFL